MRITIVQTEIEEAIRNHILSQIQVQDGMEIEIDLRATRGAEGFQADIDIHPKRPGGGSGSGKGSGPKGGSSKPLGIERTVRETKSSGRGSKGSNTGNTSEATSTPIAANEHMQEDKPVAAKTDDKVEVVIAETPADTAQIEAAAEAPAEAEAEAPAKPVSLFAQKKKPEADSDEQPASETKSIFGDLKRPVNA